MELSQEEKDKLYELINKLSPCIAISSKKNIEQLNEVLGKTEIGWKDRIHFYLCCLEIYDKVKVEVIIDGD